MDLELRYFDGCPHWKTAEERLRQALATTGQTGVEFTYQKVTSPEGAERLSFRGSPTILIHGRDPFTNESAPVGLACRIYQTEAGAEGAPSVAQLSRALRA
ncbi:MAG: thioredoxin family protein [Acidimicrobiia bacterium]